MLRFGRVMKGSDVPQADSLDKLRAVLEVVVADPRVSSQALERKTELSSRHVSYHLAALRTLGLLVPSEDAQLVTPRAHALVRTRRGSRAEASTWQSIIESSEVIRALAPGLFSDRTFRKDAVARRIQREAGLSPTTAKRRATTLASWRTKLVEDQLPLELATSSRAADEPLGLPRANDTLRGRITSLRLRRFKGFADASIVMGGFTVVVGTNASGKSNLRDALRFLHGLARGYTLAESIGEKWVEGGVLQWKGIRGGIKEATYRRSRSFALDVTLEIPDGDQPRRAVYRIEVEVGRNKPPRVVKESLEIKGRGAYIFDSHPEKHAPSQTDPLHLVVRLKKGHQRGQQGRQIAVISDRPALHQLVSHPDVKPKEIRVLCELVLEVLRSMRFLDLAPDAMRMPSLPGQSVLGDRGENLSSVLQSICRDSARKRALTGWLRELTPLDVVDFEFPSDQTGRVLVTLIEEGGTKTSGYSASDGTLRFLAMIAAFLGPDSTHFYFFEELETGLHPTRLHLLLNLLEQQTRRREAQVVATTHSPQLLAFLSPDTLECSALTYRLEGVPEQQIQRILDLPGAKRVLESQDLATLFASGWLEDAVELTQTDPDDEAGAA